MYSYYARATRLPTYRRGRPVGISGLSFFKIFIRSYPSDGTRNRYVLDRTRPRNLFLYRGIRTAAKWQQLFDAVETPRLWNFGFSIPSTSSDVVRLRQHNCCFRRRFQFKTTMGPGFPRIVDSKIVFSSFCVGDLFRKFFSSQCWNIMLFK